MKKHPGDVEKAGVNTWSSRAAKDAGSTLGGAAVRDQSACFHGGPSHPQTSQRACGQTAEVIPPPSTPTMVSHANYVFPCVAASLLPKLAEE